MLANVQALLAGEPAVNMLLYGDAGTGKSSTIKAIVNEYREEGLRLVEVRKNQLFRIPPLLEQLAELPLKFIVFIDDLSFHVEKGEFVSIIGPSGCGKSTIFRLINRLLQPKSGEIRIAGESIYQKKSPCGYMPQQDLLFPWRTVEENLRLPMEIRGGLSKAEMKESVDLIEQIIQEGAISDANLRLLVDSIVISEKDKKLHIKINLNAKFERHKDCYDEEGNLTESVFIA